MLDCSSIYEVFCEVGVGLFAGVPDSLLKDFCGYVTDHAECSRHLITANEGAAVSVAAGHHLATGGIALAYMQNSGLGNAVNPLVSLAAPEVYGIPMLLLVGWRGEPGQPDEPQHVKQGQITLPLLKILGLPHAVLPDTLASARNSIRSAADEAVDRCCPYALVVRNGTFVAYKARTQPKMPYARKREEAIKQLVDSLGPQDVVVSTTGKASRELFEYRVERGQDPGRDFLTVGSMGHASQIALGIALAQPRRRVFCFDGDGAVIMHLGALAVIGSVGPANFVHVVLNNGAHDSVGGQPTAALAVDLPAIALACGYRAACCVEPGQSLAAACQDRCRADGPTLLEIRVAPGARPDLGRPTTSLAHNKAAFLRFVQS